MESEEDPFWSFHIPQQQQQQQEQEPQELAEPAYTVTTRSGFYYREEEESPGLVLGGGAAAGAAAAADSELLSKGGSAVEHHNGNAIPSKSLQTLEAVLQKVLRNLSVLADNFDRVVSSIEAEGRADHSRGWTQRLLKRIASGLWSQLLHTARIISQKEKKHHSSSSSNIWACSIFILVFWLALVGFRSRFKQTSLVSQHEEVVLPAEKIQLPDGRSIAYREQGARPDEARHSVLVVHGFLSSRLAGIPGINASLLEEYGVRLVSYDLPGFGDSDVHDARDFNTSAQDMELLADKLGLGEKFWLLAYSEGGPHAWAAIRYIPDRLAGVAMISPSGNPYGGSEEARAAWKVWSFRRKLLYFIAKRLPSLLGAFTRKTLMNKVTKIRKSLYATVGAKDQALFEQPEFVSLWEKDVQESMKQQSVLPLEQELLLLVNDWGFDLDDLKLSEAPLEGFMKRVKSYFSQHGVELEGFKQPIHVWQGTDDVLVPAAMNDQAKRVLPHINLHKLQDEGHFSWFYLCQECHRSVLKTLFGKAEGPCRRRSGLDEQNAEAASETAEAAAPTAAAPTAPEAAALAAPEPAALAAAAAAQAAVIVDSALVLVQDISELSDAAVAVSTNLSKLQIQ